MSLIVEGKTHKMWDSGEQSTLMLQGFYNWPASKMTNRFCGMMDMGALWDVIIIEINRENGVTCISYVSPKGFNRSSRWRSQWKTVRITNPERVEYDCRKY